MRYYNWYYQCPYLAQQSRFSYPVAQNLYGYYEQPNEQDDIPELLQNTDENITRTQRDVERVISMVEQELSNEINQLVNLGIKKEVVVYFIREMVEYLDKNYDKYNSPLLMSDITSASEDIKTKYYWIFNILRICGVPFPLQMKLLYSTVRTAFQNLRPAQSTQTQMQR